jgi:hypothetical protein
MIAARKMRKPILGYAVLAGLAVAAIVATGLPSTNPVGATGVTGSSAPGSYGWVATYTPPGGPPATFGGDLAIASNGTFSATIGDVYCVGIWSMTGNYIAMEMTGPTGGTQHGGSSFGPCPGPGYAWVLAGHMYRKGFKSGTMNVWQTDATGNPTSSVQTGTWFATRCPSGACGLLPRRG